ncbi:MAG: UvrD-helicase domain-containing protein [Gammaproteobacteria bacterium]|nr:UvrD-helicase domain-containing protein [Gammaproteobacteria bacterium]
MTDTNTYLNQALNPPPDQDQRDTAIDPTRSFIVQAPAGSGKTTLLVTRYLALLATVNEPEEILAITFTRKAAQEMRARVIEELKSDSREQARAAMQRSADLNWQLLATPQRMRIQTIDSFQQGLVQQLPYQSRLSLDYETIDNAESLYEEAVENTLERIAARKASFGDEIAAMVATFDNNPDNVRGLLVSMLTKRDQWLEHIPALASGVLGRVNAERLTQQLQAARTTFCDERKQAFIDAIAAKDRLWPDCIALVRQSKPARKSPGQFYDMKDPSDWDHLVDIFLTKSGTWRKRISKTEGISSTDSVLKEKWESTIGALQATVTMDKLGKLRGLPAEELTETQKQDLANYALTLLACVQELTRLFDSRKVVDFTERAIAARRALRVDGAPTELALALDYRIRHILVDEYQDTSIAQNEFLNLLMEGWEPDDGNTFFAVGDPMQSIYKFRDADLSNFLKADTGGIKNRQVDKLQLTVNFRSSKHLVNWCNEVFAPILGEANDAELGQVAFAKSIEIDEFKEGSTHGLTLVESGDRQREADLVAQKIRELHQKYPSHSIAALFRTRSDIGAYFEAFRHHGVRWRGVDMESLSNFGEVRDLFCLTCALIDLDDELAWSALLLSPLAGVELLDLETLREHECARDMVLAEPTNALSDVASAIIKRVRGPIVEALNNQHRSLRSRVERAWYQLGGANAYAFTGDPNRETAVKDNAQHYLDILEGFEDDYLDKNMLWDRLESALATENDPNAYVEVMTIHNAKGLEFDHIVLPALSQLTRPEQRLPLYIKQTDTGTAMAAQNPLEPDPLHTILFNDEAQRNKNEISRLFYVGATRAKTTLWLYGTTNDLEKRPSANSFLRLIWDVTGPDAWETLPSEEEIEDELTGAKIWQRIDPSFKFKPQSKLPVFEANILLDQALENGFADQINTLLSSPIAIGQLVHGELQRMVEVGSLELPDSQRVEMWRNDLRIQGFSARQIGDMLETVQDQLRRTVSSDVGHWLLNANHVQSEVEAAYTANKGSNQRISIVDRTFIHEGYRWIVDYKTSMIPDDRDLPLDEKALNFQPQLVRYAELFEAFDATPIKAAIFFTDVAELVEVDVSTVSRQALIDGHHAIDSRWLNDQTFKRNEMYES